MLCPPTATRYKLQATGYPLRAAPYPLSPNGCPLRSSTPHVHMHLFFLDSPGAFVYSPHAEAA